MVVMDKYIFNGWEYPSVKADPPIERFLKIILSPQTNGYKEASVVIAHIPPGSSAGLHTHGSDEIMFVSSGRGEGIVGVERDKIETDSVILAPKGIEHELKNTSETETLKVFCVYVPAVKPTPILEKLITKTKEFLKLRSNHPS
jgi:mannose-6-phosphate isomerase-like protein (cupin superfamily)